MSEPAFDFDQLKFTGEVPKDPAPKEPRKSPSKSARPVGRPSTQSKIAEVEAEIGNVLKLALLPVLMKDLHYVIDENNNPTGEVISCANVFVEFDMKKGRPELTQEGKTFCEALAVIVFESPFLMKVLNAGDDMGKWLKLLMAVQPLAMTVFHNHVRMRHANHGENSVG